MSLLIIWGVLALLVGIAADRRGRNGLGWALLSLVFSPLLAILFLLVMRNIAEEEERRRVSDGQWLEQSVRFHFLRLEEDLRVLARHDTRPRHGKAQDATDPLHAARAGEVTSLWRLGAL